MKSTVPHYSFSGLVSASLYFIHRHLNSKFRPLLDTNTLQKSTFHCLYKKGGWDSISHKTWENNTDERAQVLQSIQG